MRETELYGRVIVKICGHPALRLADGSQAVRLSRRFVGLVRHYQTTNPMQIGEAGEADLQGSLAIDYVNPVTKKRYRFAVALSIEIKTKRGTLEPEQQDWCRAVERRGELYILPKRSNDPEEIAESAVWLLVGHRATILRGLQGD